MRADRALKALHIVSSVQSEDRRSKIVLAVPPKVGRHAHRSAGFVNLAHHRRDPVDSLRVAGTGVMKQCGRVVEDQRGHGASLSSGAMTRWDAGEIADALGAALAARAEAIEAEQAVVGIDMLDELELHPVVAQGLRGRGLGVYREERYPRDRERRRRSHGERCDFVLTPDGKALVRPDREATMFAPPDAVPVHAAYWLEVKVVAQFTTEGANRRYSAELVSPVQQDVKKLAKDPDICHCGQALVLFTADQLVAEHDLGVWAQKAHRRGLPVSVPYVRSLRIPDRVGNTLCTMALFPIKGA